VTESNTQNFEAGGDAVIADPHGDAEAVTLEGAATEDAASLRKQLDEARVELDAAQDRYLRVRADMENFRKRLERTYADRITETRKDLLRKLLTVRDNIERALQYGESAKDGEGIMEGVRLTQYQLDQLLLQEGLKPIDAAGKPFDPHLEEAIQSVADPSVPDHTVVQVVRSGYTYQAGSSEAEVLRPAQVIVNVHAEES
jgi:molecular chaperone GrpE